MAAGDQFDWSDDDASFTLNMWDDIQQAALMAGRTAARAKLADWWADRVNAGLMAAMAGGGAPPAQPVVTTFTPAQARTLGIKV